MASASNNPSANVASTSSLTATASQTRGVEFTLFPKLALELRQMIWTEVCFQERIIDLWCVSTFTGIECGDDFFDDIGDWRPYKYRSNARYAPSLLHASQEARAVGLKHYFLEFGVHSSYIYRGTRIAVSTPPRIYVNWENDIICPLLVNEDMVPNKINLLTAFWHPENFPQIRRIAFEVCPGRISYWDPEEMDDLLRRYNIKEVILYPWNSRIGPGLELCGSEGKFTSKRLDTNFIDFENHLDESHSYSIGIHSYPKGIFNRLIEEVRLDYRYCINVECRKLRGEIPEGALGEEAENESQKDFDEATEEEVDEEAEEEVKKRVEVCYDPSHFEYPFPVNFKIMNISRIASPRID
ncbi:hypothetical protein VTL71DRAFT_15830 [Oculimacula yallundae]|uniref:2EXR domain-containing protein n=1 Tax=Oculimacula yallundae TaxID=86028 RepID=A0ABR4CCQ8_9HELO